MNPVVRSILAVILGLLAAFVAIRLVQMIGMRLYPLTAGMDPMNPETIKAAMAQIPRMALLFVLLSYAAGSVVGGWVAARFAPKAKMMHGMIVAALLCCAGLMNLMTIPHPMWFAVASSSIFWFGAWSGAQAAGTSGPAAAAAMA